MTATTAPAAPKPTRTIRLSFGGILQSEWIKFWTLRSSVWCCAILLVLVAGVSLIGGLNVGSTNDSSLPFAARQAAVANGATAGLLIAQLILAVLGVLVISGEYGTGMIRSTMTTIPKRLPALFGKGLVLAIVAFVLGLLSTYGTAFLQAPLTASAGLHPDFSDPKLNLALLGGALYLTLVTLMSFGIGAIVRNSAAGIATSLGLLLVAPGVLQLLGVLTRAAWLFNVAAVLPTSAGNAVYSYPAKAAPTPIAGVWVLDGTAGALVLLAWAAVAVIIAAILLRRRDV